MRVKLIAVLFISCIVFPGWAFSQLRQVTGSITNDNGEPVSAASVTVKGTSTGVAANEAGKFSINITGAGAVLVISSTGYLAKEVIIGSANNYNIVLTATGQMEQVVVTALGVTRRERSIGYATQQLKGENLTLTKEQNVL
jgi:hypothetical protein